MVFSKITDQHVLAETKVSSSILNYNRKNKKDIIYSVDDDDTTTSCSSTFGDDDTTSTATSNSFISTTSSSSSYDSCNNNNNTVVSSSQCCSNTKQQRRRRHRVRKNNNRRCTKSNDETIISHNNDIESVPTSSSLSLSSSCENDFSCKHFKSKKCSVNNNNLNTYSTSSRKHQQQSCYSNSTNNVSMTPDEEEQYVALDCEMVGIGQGGIQSYLARVTIVDWNYNILLDQYVHPSPDVVITDYRTAISGITYDHIYGTNSNSVDIETCRQLVLEILLSTNNNNSNNDNNGNRKKRILIGHALKNDLHCLGIQYPWYLIRDTAKYEPYMKKTNNHDNNDNLMVLRPKKLKELCMEKLAMQIQDTTHSSYEDAVAAFQLYKLVRIAWEKVMHYKIQKTTNILLLAQKQQVVEHEQ